MSERRLLERTAFDLVLSESEAILVYGNAGEKTLEFQRLDALGHRLGEPARILVQVDVVEVVAAANGAGLAAAFIGQADSGRVSAWAIRNVLPALSQPVELGSASLATRERGHVAIAAVSTQSTTESFVVFHRGGREPCRDAAAGCIDFPLYELGAAPRPRRVVLSVPAPCGRAIAGFEALGEAWFYGVCALADGRSATTMYTIERSPEYAQAEALLESCAPIGTAVVGESVILVGRCGAERRAVRVGSRSTRVAAIGMKDTAVHCVGKDGLRIRGEGTQALDVVFEGPKDRISVLFPERIVPLDARAVWTGHALLVAAPVGAELVLSRYSCGETDGELKRDRAAVP